MNSGHGPPHLIRPRLANGLTWAIAAACIGLLSTLVIERRGNLEWDDADYLRRGLTNARLAAAGGGFPVIPRAIDRMFLESPKPPWLVGWIELGALFGGRSQLDALILYSSVIPFVLLITAVIGIARRFNGPWASLSALIVLLGSPLCLSFGGKVMVETFLSLWVLLALVLVGRLIARPSRKVGLVLGVVTGLALLTKLTTALLFPGAILPLLWHLRQPGTEQRARLHALAWASLACLVVAGPWYARNGTNAVRFAFFSSRFNLVAEGRSDVLPAWARLVSLTAELPGWPLAMTLAVVGLTPDPSRGRRTHDTNPDETPPSGPGDSYATSPSPLSSTDTDDETVSHLFALMAGASAITAAGILLIPPYFDPRFLLPIWPALAVSLSGPLLNHLSRMNLKHRVLVGTGLAASLICSIVGLVNEPVTTTYWKTAGLIDRLVGTHGITNLGNLGNCAEWNVCKTGLINELREAPGSCFVLHDLSKAAPERLSKLDAVALLDLSRTSPGLTRVSPGLNRTYSAMVEALRNDPGLTRIEGLPLEGLPPLSIYVRKRGPAVKGRLSAEGEVPRTNRGTVSWMGTRFRPSPSPGRS